jgi:hypothetical protein
MRSIGSGKLSSYRQRLRLPLRRLQDGLKMKSLRAVTNRATHLTGSVRFPPMRHLGSDQQLARLMAAWPGAACTRVAWGAAVL